LDVVRQSAFFAERRAMAQKRLQNQTVEAEALGVSK
jgi:hypothetical protein